jgi:hypothetical protein
MMLADYPIPYYMYVTYPLCRQHLQANSGPLVVCCVVGICDDTQWGKISLITDMFPPLVMAMVCAYAQRTSSEPLAIMTPLLTLVGVLCNGALVKVHEKSSFTSPIILYTVMVMPPGAGKVGVYIIHTMCCFRGIQCE